MGNWTLLKGDRKKTTPKVVKHNQLQSLYDTKSDRKMKCWWKREIFVFFYPFASFSKNYHAPRHVSLGCLCNRNIVVWLSIELDVCCCMKTDRQTVRPRRLLLAWSWKLIDDVISIENELVSRMRLTWETIAFWKAKKIGFVLRRHRFTPNKTTT